MPSVTVKNDSRIDLVVQLGTADTVLCHAFLKRGQQVSWTVGPAPPWGWTIWAHMSNEDDTTWGDILLAPILAGGVVVAAAVGAGMAAFLTPLVAGAGAGAALLGGPVLIVGEAAFVAAGNAALNELAAVVSEQIMELLQHQTIDQTFVKIKSSGWFSTTGYTFGHNRCQITGGLQIYIEVSKDANGEQTLTNKPQVRGSPLVATPF